MKYLKKKDIKRRFRFANIESNRLKLLFGKTVILNNPNINDEKKAKAKELFDFTKKYKEKTRILRRCPIVNRNKVSYKKIGISRIILKDMILQGILPGYSKAVW